MTSVDPQTDNLGSAHKHSVHPTPPIMDMSNKIPTAQAGNDSSLEPDTIQSPGGSTPVGANVLAMATEPVPTDGNNTKNGKPADGLDNAMENEQISTDAHNTLRTDHSEDPLQRIFKYPTLRKLHSDLGQGLIPLDTLNKIFNNQIYLRDAMQEIGMCAGW